MEGTGIGINKSNINKNISIFMKTEDYYEPPKTIKNFAYFVGQMIVIFIIILLYKTYGN